MNSEEKFAKYGIMILAVIAFAWVVWHYFSIAMKN